MSRDECLYLDDILLAIAKIREYSAGMNFDSFSTDCKTQDAVVRNLEIIGEAAGHLSAVSRTSHPEVDWRKIIGLRNILVHEYFGVSVQILWDVIENKLELLEKTCRSMIG